MSPHLVALLDGTQIPLSRPIILIGRHQECDLQVPSRKISRRHCCIAQVNNYLVVRDLSSTNGIRINGVRVLEGVLHAGDELTIGNLHYEVRWLEDEPMPVRREVGPISPAEVDESADEPISPAEEEAAAAQRPTKPAEATQPPEASYEPSALSFIDPVPPLRPMDSAADTPLH